MSINFLNQLVYRTAELAVSYVSKKQELMSGIFVHKL